jgi:zinc transport system ATP-binding protein
MIALETEQLTVRLGGREVLADISCRVLAGEYVAVLGPNGAGKTVFLKVLLGLVRPTSGLVRVMGKDPGKVDPALIGYVPQIKTLDRQFPALAIELVIAGLHRTWKRRMDGQATKAAREALAQVGGEHLAMRSAASLSGGELQRVYLARSLVRRPRLVLLDEPNTGVDAQGETDFYRVLDTFRRESGATIIMVTHDWEVAAHHACHVMVLNQRLIRFGTAAEALCDDCLQRAYGVLPAPALNFCPRSKSCG